MKVFRNLKITGSQETLEKLIQQIENNLDQGWYRDIEAESELNFRKLYDLKMYCFSCSALDQRRACNLWLGDDASDYGRLSVSNIIPKSVSQLSYDQYNYILEEFYQRFILPASQNLKVEVNLTEAELDIRQFMKPETAAILHNFSTNAHNLDPINEVRWYNFLVAAHKDQVPLDSSTLERWLREQEGWSEDIALELAESYESGRSLLAYYDAVR